MSTLSATDSSTSAGDSNSCCIAYSPPVSVSIPATGAEAALAELCERDGAQQAARGAWAARVQRLWGPEPPYEEQPEDRSGVVLGSLLYSWMGPYIFQAAREELTEAALPRPTRGYRAYNAGRVVSAQMQRQQERRHAWDGYVGARVGVRWDGASDGVLRWVGVVQQYGTPRQLYAGVEWRVAPSTRGGCCAGGVWRRLLCRGGGGRDAEHGPGAFHRGEVDGELLFELAEGDSVATCERVEDVVLRLGVGDGRHATAADRALRRELPPSAQQPPRPVQVWWAVWELFRPALLPIVTLGVLGDACRLLQPLLLRWFVAYLMEATQRGDNPDSSDASSSGSAVGELLGPRAGWQRGVLLAACMLIVLTIRTVADKKLTHIQRRCATQVRNALSTLMFEKLFTMSTKAAHHPQFYFGRVAALVTTDLVNVGHFVLRFWTLVSVPYILVGCCLQAYSLIGASVLASGVVVAITALLQSAGIKKLAPAFRRKAAAQDARLQQTTELLSGIRVVKFMSWEPSFISRIEETRTAEVTCLKNLQEVYMLIYFFFNAAPSFAMASVFLVFSLTGHTLTPEIVFPAIALFKMIAGGLSKLPLAAHMLSNLFIALRRLNTFFDTEDDMVPLIDDAADLEAEGGATAAAAFVHAELSTYVAQEVRAAGSGDAGAAASSGEGSGGSGGAPAHGAPVAFRDDAVYELRAKTLLADVDLRIPRGQLTVVLGPTGSGKSTLLDALIGALAVTRGRVACGGRVAYVPQQPWIMNATLRDNVVFFGAADARAFERAVASSQLAADLALLADGAATEIGEKGINLSGGQKARVSLARAVYADRDVYVLDDPLSALDAHVGERVMRECVCGALAGKTRVLATHQVHVARDADYVVVLAADGRVAFQGTRAAYYRDHLSCEATTGTEAEAGGGAGERPADDVLLDGDDSAAAGAAGSADSGAGRLMTEEERFRGAVPLAVYVRYMRACGGVGVCAGVVALYLVTEVVVMAPSVWLALWSTQYLPLSALQYSVAYAVLSLLAALCVPLRYWVAMTVMRRASVVVHRDLLRSVACATLQFFDTTPIGRLISRFTNDIGNVDSDLQGTYSYLLSTVASFCSTVVTMLVSQVWVLAVLLPCVVVYGFLLRFYARANREIKRLVNVVNSPVMSVLEEAFGGRRTLLAYGVAPAVLRRAMRCADVVFTCSYLQLGAELWLSVRIELISTLISFAVALGAVLAVSVEVVPAHVGLLSLSLTLALEISGLLDSIVSVSASVEADMNSVERIFYMTDSIEHEDLRAAVEAEVAALRGSGGGAAAVAGAAVEAADASVPAERRRGGAADFGSLELAHVDMRYRPGLPLVLRDVSFAVAPGQKVGVVGRTGSGKSTLLLALLRLVEVCGGRMRVCGRDARDYGVRELRQLFSMIPQDPLLFDGTVRSNVDPFGACGDAAVWAALRQVGMEERVRGEAGGLDGRVQEGGSNYSVGQRQLLCLARALLKRGSAFLLMDEATANVDPALDRQIQLTVQHTFRDYTVVTIAHRLHTVAAYDRILVMDGGRAVEFDSPQALVEREDSVFGALVASMNSEARAAFKRTLAEKQC